MGDTKQGREKQAAAEERRQRERELEEALARGEEAEPDDESGPDAEPDRGGKPERDDAAAQLGGFDETLASHDYPTTTHELIESYGDRAVESQGGQRTIAEVLAPVDDETYDSADGVRRRVLGQLRR